MRVKKDQSGSALVYILIAIALLAALTATFMDSSSQQTSSQNTFNTVTELNTQVNLIRSTIQECVLTYPAGETALIGTLNTPYPLNPTSSELSVLVPPVTSDQVKGIRCPGNPGDSNNHAMLFGGNSGKFMPPPPTLFDPWIYNSGTDGVFFYTKTNKTDAYLQTALDKLDDQFSECEADVINASGGVINLTSALASGPQCPAGYYCFRIWMIAQPSNRYYGDTAGDEAACSAVD